jgi:hypothetical protein
VAGVANCPPEGEVANCRRVEPRYRKLSNSSSNRNLYSSPEESVPPEAIVLFDLSSLSLPKTFRERLGQRHVFDFERRVGNQPVFSLEAIPWNRGD